MDSPVFSLHDAMNAIEERFPRLGKPLIRLGLLWFVVGASVGIYGLLAPFVINDNQINDNQPNRPNLGLTRGDALWFLTFGLMLLAFWQAFRWDLRKTFERADLREVIERAQQSNVELRELRAELIRLRDTKTY
jgi:hypothetical protein